MQQRASSLVSTPSARIRTNALRQVCEGSEYLLLEIVGGNSADDGTIDLYDIGPQERNSVEVGVSGSDVIQGDVESALAVGVHETHQGAGVGCPGFHNSITTLAGGIPFRRT